MERKIKADNVKPDGLPDISRGMEGRAAGVSVQNVSGTFGTAPKIRVRGATSIYGSSKEEFAEGRRSGTLQLSKEGQKEWYLKNQDKGFEH